jgi:hypothetical protein
VQRPGGVSVLLRTTDGGHAAHLVDRVFPVAPVRQWMLSLPHALATGWPTTKFRETVFALTVLLLAAKLQEHGLLVHVNLQK